MTAIRQLISTSGGRGAGVAPVTPRHPPLCPVLESTWCAGPGPPRTSRTAPAARPGVPRARHPATRQAATRQAAFGSAARPAAPSRSSTAGTRAAPRHDRSVVLLQCDHPGGRRAAPLGVVRGGGGGERGARVGGASGSTNAGALPPGSRLSSSLGRRRPSSRRRGGRCRRRHRRGCHRCRGPARRRPPESEETEEDAAAWAWRRSSSSCSGLRCTGGSWAAVMVSAATPSPARIAPARPPKDVRLTRTVSPRAHEGAAVSDVAGVDGGAVGVRALDDAVAEEFVGAGPALAVAPADDGGCVGGAAAPLLAAVLVAAVDRAVGQQFVGVADLSGRIRFMALRPWGRWGGSCVAVGPRRRGAAHAPQGRLVRGVEPAPVRGGSSLCGRRVLGAGVRLRGAGPCSGGLGRARGGTRL